MFSVVVVWYGIVSVDRLKQGEREKFRCHTHDLLDGEDLHTEHQAHRHHLLLLRTEALLDGPRGGG